jgi:hypothetical protein
MPPEFFRSRLAYCLLGTYLAIGYRGIGWFNHYSFQESRAYLHTFGSWLPYLPWMVWIYLSYFVLMTLPLLLPFTEERGLLMRRMFTVSVIAQSCFLLFPTAVDRPAIAAGGSLTMRTLAAVYAWDYKFNCFPTLHSAHSFLISKIYADSVGRFKWPLKSWAFCVATSVFFVRQHHWVDYLAAGVLAYSVDAWFRRRESGSALAAAQLA